MIECTPFFAYESFEATARGVMELLQARLPMTVWMVSRIQGDQFIVLQTQSQIPAESPQALTPGTAMPWKSVYCHQMVAGLGPIIAPDINAVPAYRDMELTQAFRLQSYVGVPLLKEDGALFGTLCAVSQARLPDDACEQKSLLEMMARMLSTVLGQELRAEESVREAERCRAESMRDGPTGLYNRRAMQKLMDAEESRCRRYGQPASVIIVDLNGLKSVNDQKGHAAGDAMIRQAAEAIKTAARDVDLVGRVGGDEFVVLAVDCDEYAGDQIGDRIRQNLSAAGLSAGVGVAPRQPGQTLYHAMDLADQRMYADKRRYKSAAIVPLTCDVAA